MSTLFIIWAVLTILSAIVTAFLATIDVINEDTAFAITCMVFCFPFGIAFIILLLFRCFYELCAKHRDKIRKLFHK